MHAMTDYQDKTEPRRADVFPPDYDDNNISGPGCWVWVLVMVFGGLLAIAIVLTAGFAGFNDGVNTARTTATAVRQSEIARECDILPTDIAAGRVGLVQNRYQSWEAQGSLPGCALSFAPDATRIFIESQITPTATPTATFTPEPPTPTNTVPAVVPTSDTVALTPQATSSTNNALVAELNTYLAEAQAQFDSADYEEAIRTLDAIAAVDPTFQTSSVNNLIYRSLRQQALNEFRLPNGSLAKGIQYTNRARQYGDVLELNFEASVAQLYLDAQGFIDVDYGRAIAILNQIRPLSQNYRDTNQLLFDQLEKFGDAYALGGEPCRAVEQYNVALTLFQNPQVQQKRDTNQQTCSGFGVPAVTPDPNNPNAPTPEPTQGLAPIGQRP